MPTTPPTRRRWFQFELRTMFVVVIVVAIPLTWVVKERRRSLYEHQFAKQLRSQGFKEVTLGGIYDSSKLRGRGEPQGWWRDLARQILGERILTAYLPPHNFSDLTPLTGLTNLQMLAFSHTSVSDLAPLIRLEKLRAVELSGTQVRDLTPLLRLKNLVFVGLRGAPVTSEQVDALQKSLPNCKIDRDQFPNATNTGRIQL